MLLCGTHITAELSARPQRTEMATLSGELLLLPYVECTMHCVVSVYFAVGLLYRAQAGSDRESNSSKTAAYQRPCGQPGAAGILQVQ